jgi:carboxylate-amine ligase
MIEINSSVHSSAQELLSELVDLQQFLLAEGENLHIIFCGGGTHPFQKWKKQKIFPTPRYKNLSKKFRYLSKRATVFGQHIHVGCRTGDEAIYLAHVLARYVPQLIAMSSSSPFYEGTDTGYATARSTVFNSFPLSGVMPFVTNWQEFSEYFYKMRKLGIFHSMKDVYWDIRPKPEFGTVEIRVCDTPLTINKAVMIAAYIQALALYLLEEKPEQPKREHYYLYPTNRFEASRYGLEGNFINPYTYERSLVSEDILDTCKKIQKYANQLNSAQYIQSLIRTIKENHTDALKLRQWFKELESLPRVVAEQCKIWAGNSSSYG